MICLHHHLRLLLIDRQVDLAEVATGDVPSIYLLTIEALDLIFKFSMFCSAVVTLYEVRISVIVVRNSRMTHAKTSWSLSGSVSC